MPEPTEPTYALPNHTFGTLTGLDVDTEQRACRTTARNSSTLEEFVDFMDTLGIWPDPTYQNYLKEQ